MKMFISDTQIFADSTLKCGLLKYLQSVDGQLGLWILHPIMDIEKSC